MLNSKIILIPLSVLLLFTCCKLNENENNADKDVEDILKLIRSEKYSDVIISASKSIEKYPSDPRLYYNRGYAYHMTKDEKARQDFETCIKLEPGYHNGYYGMAMSYELSKEYYLAEKNYIKAIELSPDNERKATFLSGLARFYATQKKFLQAIEIQKQAIELDDRADFYLNLGWFLLSASHNKEAEATWLKALEKDNFVQIDFKHKIMVNMARYYYNNRKFKKAGIYIDKALELAPDNKLYIDLSKKIKRYV